VVGRRVYAQRRQLGNGWWDKCQHRAEKRHSEMWNCASHRANLASLLRGCNRPGKSRLPTPCVQEAACAFTGSPIRSTVSRTAFWLQLTRFRRKREAMQRVEAGVGSLYEKVH
jgi:hypothetical protein